jgi:hypothetical protein
VVGEFSPWQLGRCDNVKNDHLNPSLIRQSTRSIILGPFAQFDATMALRRSIQFCIWTSPWWNQDMMVAAAFYSNVNLQVARDAEAAFLQELHDALRMDQKSPAVHNWFRNNSGGSSSICGFTGVQCDMHGLVKILDLSSKGLDGTLPASFAALTRMQRLLLRNNAIGGNLPWGLPETLGHFNVDRNRLQGPIPPFEFQTASSPSSPSVSPQLERLILSDNLLGGSLPTTICSLRQLKALNLSRNPDIQGSLPECLANLTDLRGLQVLGTRIVGPILPRGLCRTEKETNSTLEGYCARFDFCLDGYQQVTSYHDGIERGSCQSCPLPSNVLASRTCEWVESPGQHRSLSPQSERPSDAPSLAPSSTPSGVPSALPLRPSTAPQVPSKAPTTRSTPNVPTTYRSSVSPWKYPKIPSASNDFVPSNSPTLRPSSEYSDRSEANGMQSQGRATNQEEDRSFYDDTAFLPVFVLLCIMGLAGSLLAIPSLWNELNRRRRIKAFSVLAGPADDATPCGEDEENNDEDDEEEITFSKDAWCGGLDDLLEAGVNSSSIDDCGDYGCHISHSPFEASSITDDTTAPTTEPQPSTKNPVTCRPCVVRPQTVAANPKVHFLLLARSLSSAEDEFQDPVGASQDEDGNDGEHLSNASASSTMNNYSEIKNTARTAFSSTVGSLFCAPSCMMPNRRSIPSTNKTSGTILVEQEEIWTFSRPPAHDPRQGLREDEDDFYRPDVAAASSSLSSTTPMLNPIDSLRAKMAPLSRRMPIAPNRRVDKDADALIAEYARKYFPDEAATPPPPVDQVDCFPDADVSFSLSVSQDGPGLQHEQPRYDNTTGRHQHADLTSFRPPRFYKKTNPTPHPTPVPHVAENHTQANEDYSVLGIRSPFADHQSDDEYEVEVLEYTKKEDPPERRTHQNVERKWV